MKILSGRRFVLSECFLVVIIIIIIIIFALGCKGPKLKIKF